MHKEKDIKYLIKSNNYVGLLFFALVLASTLYIIKTSTTKFQELEPTTKNIITTEKKKKEITEITPEILDLQNYLNIGDINTFNIYQSNYIYNETIKKEQLTTETMLYMAYKYIEKNTDFTNYTNYITCEEATLINISDQLTQCGGTKTSSTNYIVNKYITKDLLTRTIQKLFNININDYTNFYISENNLCYYINNEYICVSHTTAQPTRYGEKEFIKAYKYDNKIEIIEKYRFVDNGIFYKGFNSSEIGEGYYKSTFNKVNGTYNWEKTEYIKN
jgi:hypothetical protein